MADTPKLTEGTGEERRSNAHFQSSLSLYF